MIYLFFLQIIFISCGVINDKCCCKFEKEADVGCTKEIYQGKKKLAVWKTKCVKNTKTGLPEIKIIKTGVITDGVVDIVSYRCDGKIIKTSTRIVNNDFADGEVLWLRENEMLFLRENYKRGKLNGVWIYYNENGKVIIEQNFVDGERVGAFKLFYENGKIFQEGFFNKRSQRDGIWKEYDISGKLIKTTKFKDGERI